MSQENVEVVRQIFGSFEDGADIAALFRDDAAWTRRHAEVEALFEPDYAVAWIAQGQHTIEATGPVESRRAWLDWLEPWETYRPQIERIVPVDDKVLVLARVHGRMAGTQNDVELIFASLYVLQNRRVTRIEHYADRAAALEAAGLRA